MTMIQERYCKFHGTTVISREYRGVTSGFAPTTRSRTHAGSLTASRWKRKKEGPGLQLQKLLPEKTPKAGGPHLKARSVTETTDNGRLSKYWVKWRVLAETVPAEVDHVFRKILFAHGILPCLVTFRIKFLF